MSVTGTDVVIAIVARDAEATIERALAPRESARVEFTWTWPASPVFVRVEVDPEGRIDEICEANNLVCDLNIARPMQWGYQRKRLEGWYRRREEE